MLIKIYIYLRFLHRSVDNGTMAKIEESLLARQNHIEKLREKAMKTESRTELKTETKIEVKSHKKETIAAIKEEEPMEESPSHVQEELKEKSVKGIEYYKYMTFQFFTSDEDLLYSVERRKDTFSLE